MLEHAKLTKNQGVQFILAVHKLFREVTYEKMPRFIWIRLENIDQVDVRPNVVERTFRAYIKCEFNAEGFEIDSWFPRGEYPGVVEKIEVAFKTAAESTEEVECPEYIYCVPLKAIAEGTLE